MSQVHRLGTIGHFLTDNHAHAYKQHLDHNLLAFLSHNPQKGAPPLLWLIDIHTHEPEQHLAHTFLALALTYSKVEPIVSAWLISRASTTQTRSHPRGPLAGLYSRM